MPSGSEQSPDYGGREPTRRDWIAVWFWIAVLMAVVGFAFLGPDLSQESTLRVIDGDTLKLGDESIRISNIDTPERGGRADGVSKAFRLSCLQE